MGRGVRFDNTHSLFPTFTTANASAMATGHYLGDTGDFSNTIYTAFPVPGAGDSLTPFLESDPVLGDVDEHFSGNYLNEETILKAARDAGFSTASVGKLGPALIFDPTERSGEQTVVIDDSTGRPPGIPLSAEMKQRLGAAELGAAGPDARRKRPSRAISEIRHACRQRRAAELVRRRRDEGDSADVPRTRKDVRPRLLVARSRRHAA